MKKVLLFGLSLAALTFTSCSDDDGDSASIEGKWYYSEQGVSANGAEVLTDYMDHEDGCEKDYVEFLADGVFKDVDYFNSDCETFIDETTWSRSGNSLTIGEGEDAETATIATLSGSTLKITTSETIDGQTINYVEVYTRE